MANIGDSLADFTLNTYKLGTPDSLHNYDSNHGRKVVVLSFIDIMYGWEWLSRLRDVQLWFDSLAAADTNIAATDVAVIPVLFNYLNKTEIIAPFEYGPEVAVDWIDKKNGGSGITTNAVILMDTKWYEIAGDPHAVAEGYYPDWSGTINEGKKFWWTYILNNNFQISDIFHFGSSDNIKGNGTDINGIAFNWGAISDDLKLDKFKDFTISRIKDMLNTQPVVASSLTAGSNVSDGTVVTLSFSGDVDPDPNITKKALAVTRDNLVITDGAGASIIDTVLPDLPETNFIYTPITSSQYIDGSTRETCTLTFTNTGTYTQIKVSLAETVGSVNIKDTNDNPFVLVGGTNKVITYNVGSSNVDVYLRNGLGDTGDGSYSGGLSLSPDIFAFKNISDIASNPQEAYGHEGGEVNNNALGPVVEFGQENYIFVRAFNRGGSSASGVSATVYWANFSVSIHPDDWNLIGEVDFPIDIPPSNGGLIVSNRLDWPSAAIPPVGHYCLIATIGNNQDSEPSQTDLSAQINTVSDYLDTIRTENNLTYRNINVIDINPKIKLPPDAPPGLKEFIPLPFLFPGSPGKKDSALPFQLEVEANFPSKSRVFIEVPLIFFKAWQKKNPDLKAERITDKEERAIIPLKAYGTTTFDDVILESKSKHQIKIYVFIPEKRRKGRYVMSARQLYKEHETGSVAWLFGPKKKRRKWCKWLRSLR